MTKAVKSESTPSNRLSTRSGPVKARLHGSCGSGELPRYVTKGCDWGSVEGKGDPRHAEKGPCYQSCRPFGWLGLKAGSSVASCSLGGQMMPQSEWLAGSQPELALTGTEMCAACPAGGGALWSGSCSPPPELEEGARRWVGREGVGLCLDLRMRAGDQSVLRCGHVMRLCFLLAQMRPLDSMTSQASSLPQVPSHPLVSFHFLHSSMPLTSRPVRGRFSGDVALASSAGRLDGAVIQ